MSPLSFPNRLEFLFSVSFLNDCFKNYVYGRMGVGGY